jgi:hypothetical protein
LVRGKLAFGIDEQYVCGICQTRRVLNHCIWYFSSDFSLGILYTLVMVRWSGALSAAYFGARMHVYWTADFNEELVGIYREEVRAACTMAGLGKEPSD